MKETDYFSPAGAAILAGRIKDYWQVRGYDVAVHLVNDNGLVAVRSTLRNGWPSEPVVSDVG